MKARLLGSVSACLVNLVTTLSSASVGQPLEDRLPAIPGGADYQAHAADLTIGDISAMPVAVWVVVIGLIAVVGIARRNSAGR